MYTIEGHIVSMCRVHVDELCDVCMLEKRRGLGHATAVCTAAIKWARPRRLVAATDCSRKRAWYERMGCLV